MQKVIVLPIFSLLLLLMVGCSNGGGGDSSQFLNNDVPGGEPIVGVPPPTPFIPGPETAAISVSDPDTMIEPGTTHTFTVQITGVAGTGSFASSNINVEASGGITGLPVSIFFSSLTLVDPLTGTFIATGTFSGPVAGGGTLNALLVYAEGNLSVAATVIFTVTGIPTSEICNNGMDDDMDGLADCDDPDCAADSDCIPEICDNGIDDDGDGLVDAADPECQCGGSFISSPGTTITLGAGFTDTITLPGAGGTVADVRVGVNITHTFIGDVALTLNNPDGATAVLIDGVGGSADDMMVIFDDAAGTSASSFGGGGGFGSFSPSPGSMSTFVGGTCGGDWGLLVVDDFSGDDGTLIDWAIAVNGATLPAPFE